MPRPGLIIHGGLGASEADEASRQVRREALLEILKVANEGLKKGGAREAVVRACALLEDCPLFNAGTGATIQRDGQIRLSCALMDGREQRFSGLVNARYLKNPIRLAEQLQSRTDRLLDPHGAELLARSLGEAVYEPALPEVIRRWADQRFEAQYAGTHGTVGAAAVDGEGGLAAATSTGGRFMAGVGRVSDSCTPAGNYATDRCAVSCTGHGEDILDEALAARIAIRVGDGMSLPQAFERSFAEAEARGRDFAAIAIDSDGRTCWSVTMGILVAAYFDGNGAFCATF
ncbi:isoaspartyl peptidase/L-asparaginase [Gloeobacter morelensis]|uniref:Isoaspartyl peptidase/L-asparaginase n=1 Tax=Gloeobacter morelensis MG652769 TaxID=2781736 RepID=A0ABY3PSX1_9CYAN|nr:isoaspartyl peptidase/L-asparaginase [Gloeobacter morelensis]UFP96732.1 isoaspartyl peptidase/L-asparaginase [Gloeobacter morelensis MG652769]